MQHISPFLSKGEEAWWVQTSTAYCFMDEDHHHDEQAAGPQLFNYRTTTQKQLETTHRTKGNHSLQWNQTFHTIYTALQCRRPSNTQDILPGKRYYTPYWQQRLTSSYCQRNCPNPTHWQASAPRAPPWEAWESSPLRALPWQASHSGPLLSKLVTPGPSLGSLGSFASPLQAPPQEALSHHLGHALFSLRVTQRCLQQPPSIPLHLAFLWLQVAQLCLYIAAVLQ